MLAVLPRPHLACPVETMRRHALRFQIRIRLSVNPPSIRCVFSTLRCGELPELPELFEFAAYAHESSTLRQFLQRRNLRLPAGEPFADRRRCAESCVDEAKKVTRN